MITVMNKDIEVNNGNYKLILTYIGEGRSGDYDNSDTTDYPHIRADVFSGNKLLASTCTGEDANLPIDEAEEYANEILKRFDMLKNNNIESETALAMSI